MPFIIIPTKPFNEGKSRLAQVLSLDQRCALNELLFRRTLDVAQQCGEVVVVSRSRRVRRLAKQAGAWALVEAGHTLNQAVQQATDWVRLKGGREVLIMPTDLVRLNTSAVTQILAYRTTPTQIVIAPCQRKEGTNGLLLPTSLHFPYAFGPDSFQAHQRLVRAQKTSFRVFEHAGFSFDLDTPRDWLLWQNRLDISDYVSALSLADDRADTISYDNFSDWCGRIHRQ